jgi:carbon monoxide dehydrogenase subunit G
MRIEGEHVFKGPRADVYEMFRDPQVLASALPGTQELKKIDDNHFEGTINLRIGPVSGSFAGKLEVSDEVPPEKCTLTVEGRGAPGFAKGVGHVQFLDQGDGTTLMKYDGDVQIGGTLASVGQRMIDSVSKSMIRQGFETFDKALESRLAAKASGNSVEFTPPTEAEFASKVAKDMTKQILKTQEARILMYLIPMVAILGIIAYLLSR